MWTGVVLLLACMTIISGKTIPPEYMGCYSTTFVNQYAFYYKFSQSTNIEQGFAACNNRLTRYMGLQVDESFTVNNFVYCGNDLTEVSPKLDSFECSTCQENATLSCGGIHSMSVYKLRESTPLAMLLKTERGVELLQDNITTVKVPYELSSEHHLVDYIYTEDLILFVMYREMKRSGYNNIRMQFAKPKHILVLPNWCWSFAIDFTTHHIFFDGADSDLMRTDTRGSPSSTVSRIGHEPIQTTIDPFNRSLIFKTTPFNNINIWLLDDQRLITHTLNHLNIETIIAFSIDIQERYLYAIVQLMDDSSSHLVRLDYGISRIILLFSGPQLVDATVLEVFRDHAAWLRKDGGVSVLYTCKLTPKCALDNLTSYSSNQEIYDFTIYHPEKQTPGRKRLCANMTCSHGCQLFSPFTARCTCPSWMELGPENSTCNKRPTTTTTTTTTKTTIPPPPTTTTPTITITMTTTTTPSPTTTTMTTTTTSSTTPTNEASTTTRNDESSVSVLADVSTEDISPSPSGVETPKNKKIKISEMTFYESLIMICFMIILSLLIGMCLLILNVYDKINHSPLTLDRPIELTNNCNSYSEFH